MASATRPEPVKAPFEELYAGRHRGVPAVVLGNGRSRLEYELPEGAIIIACNAAYRDVPCHYLCSSDTRMVTEILKSAWKGKLVLRKREYYQRLADAGVEVRTGCELVLSNPHLQLTTTGSFAMYVACVLGCAPIYLVGFDGVGPEKCYRNVYEGTSNYAKEGEHRGPSWTHIRNSLRRVLTRYPDADFRVVGESFLSAVLDGPDGMRPE